MAFHCQNEESYMYIWLWQKCSKDKLIKKLFTLQNSILFSLLKDDLLFSNFIKARKYFFRVQSNISKKRSLNALLKKQFMPYPNNGF